MLRICTFSAQMMSRSNFGSRHTATQLIQKNRLASNSTTSHIVFARLFSTSKIIKQEGEEEENYINRLIERKKVYDERERQIPEEKRDPWDIYKNANTPREKPRWRSAEGFNKERRSSKKRSAEEETETEEPLQPINKEGGAVPGEKPMKKSWKDKLQEKRDKIQTKHGKLVDPSDLDLHYKNKKVNEMKVYGKNACLSIFEKRKEDIIKCIILKDLMEDKRFRPLFKYMAERKLTYRAAEEEDLRAFSDSIHHEGIVMVTKRPEVLDVDQTLEMVLSKYTQFAKNKREKSIHEIKNAKYALENENEDEIQREELDVEEEEETPKQVANTQLWEYQTIAMLENVQNPHNLGALVRVLAFFGVKMAFVANLDAYNIQKEALTETTPSWKLKKLAQEMTEVQSPTVYRLAQGGMEHVAIVPVLNPEEFSRVLYKLKRRGNYKIVATSSTSPRKDSLWDEKVINDLHDKNRILLFGSEAEGLSRRVLNSADYIIEVPGVGAIESLNVATSAAAVLTMLNRPK